MDYSGEEIISETTPKTYINLIKREIFLIQVIFNLISWSKKNIISMLLTLFIYYSFKSSITKLSF
jgi:hypothetical protein